MIHFPLISIGGKTPCLFFPLQLSDLPCRPSSDQSWLGGEEEEGYGVPTKYWDFFLSFFWCDGPEALV